MSFETCYISSNVNQTPTAVHWGKNNKICYASCNSILIYDPNFGSGGRVIKTLVKHTKRVNSVKWISKLESKNENEIEIVSGSTDGTLVLWTKKGQEYEAKVLQDHTSIVNIVDASYKNDNNTDLVIASASMDQTVKIWTRKNINDDVKLMQTIDCGYHICIALRLGVLPSSNKLILACALDNSKITLYIEDETKQEFIKSIVLSGHEDWVRGLDFKVDETGDLLLASCAQDNYIRLWRITSKNDLEGKEHHRKQIITTSIGEYYLYLESILTGHEGWVYSSNWSPNEMKILSASIDKSMILWEFDKISKLWLENVRVGEVGGNTLGFYGGVFSPDGENILAYSYHGAFHIWKREKEFNKWAPVVTIGGHFKEVVDLHWEPQGDFLVTVSADQTTRIHGPWQQENKEVTWHEMARPQVHGYDINCLAVLSRYKFASGAEEKIVRFFEAPKNFVENIKRICKIKKDRDEDSTSNSSQMGPKGASVPSLGLSNKAVYTDDNIEQATPIDKKNPFPEESHFVATELSEPPTEETLLQNTLWPEVQKLYGHGYEVYSIAASKDAKYLASACKATNADHASILLWDTSNWQQIQKLRSHTLTVAQMEFSADSKNLLSVSRDRRWSLFSKNEKNEFELVATCDKKTSIHTRIIWTCAWSHDSKHFVTGSRDGKVVVWAINPNKEKVDVLGQCEAACKHLDLPKESITAVCFAPFILDNNYLIATGFESGIIHLYKWSPNEWVNVLTLDNSLAHHSTVKKLEFRPVLGKAGEEEDKNIIQLASCSSDFTVKVYNIFIDKL